MTTYDIVLAALFAALIAVLGVMPGIPLAFIPVPVTLQSMGVMLAGAVLGPWRGAAAVAIVVALAATGMPVLAGGRGGLSVFAGPTAGFIFGWILAAFVAGAVAARLARDPADASWRTTAAIFLGCVLGGIVALYLCGIAWLVAVTGVAPGKAALGMLAFVPGDALKAAVAAAVATAIRRVHPIEPR